MDIYVKKFFAVIFSPFSLIFNHDFIINIDFTHVAVSSRATDDVKIRSHIEYLIQAYRTLMFIWYSKSMINVAALAVYDTIE